MLKVYLLFNGEGTINNHKIYKFYGNPLTNSETLELLYTYKENNSLEGTNKSYEIKLTERLTGQPIDITKIASYQQIISGVDNSLFFNCNLLKTTEGMFYNTPLINLPNYLFESDKIFTELNNISFMFADCQQCYNSTGNNNNLLDSTWLDKCPQIVNINGLFANLGSNITDDDYIYQKSLGTAFNKLTNLRNIEYSFAGIPHLISTTNLNNGFLYEALLNNLENCTGVLALSPLNQITKVFESERSNKIKALNYGFSFCISNNNITLPNYNKFNSLNSTQSEAVWEGTKNINYNTWPPISYNWATTKGYSEPKPIIQSYINNYIKDKVKNNFSKLKAINL